jgi:hypothetical protein
MKFFVFICLTGLLIACNNNKKPEQENNASIVRTLSDSLYHEVMKGHDLAMKDIGPMIRYKALIKMQKDSLAALKPKNSGLLKTLAAVSDSLDNANALMNTWMQEFDPEKAGKTEEEKVAFFTAEKEKVDTIKVRMVRSIELAKTIMGK